MAPPYSVKFEREKKLKSLLSFASSLEGRCTSSPHDPNLVEDLQAHVRTLPLQASSTVTAKRDELDRLGTELWNLSTRLRRDDKPDDGNKDELARRNQRLCLLRVFAFLLLDTVGGHATKTRESKHYIRLMKVALKAARVCIDNNELSSATKVLERAADYQEAMSKEFGGERNAETDVIGPLCADYFAVRTTLAWRQGRMDTAEHMFAKSVRTHQVMKSSAAESFADLLYEMGRDLLRQRKYELAIKWLNRAHDMIGAQDLEQLSSEAGELRLSIMQSIIQAHIETKHPESQQKACHMLTLLEADYGEKMTVQLLKLELLSAAEVMDSSQYYAALLKMVRVVVLNDTNFKTIMHHVHKLKEHNNDMACKILDYLIDSRLYREENQVWIEKAVITRVWAGTTNSHLDGSFETLQNLFDSVLQNAKVTLTAPATHAAQTLLWKRAEAAYNQGQFVQAQSWYQICLHPLFVKAGELNKSKVARKIMQCAFSRQDYSTAREIFSNMSEFGKAEPVTRYLLYKVALHSADPDLASQCLDVVCRQSSKDATLLYACVLEAQSIGDKKQAIAALEKVLDKYDYGAPAGIHLPALLRLTIRLLSSEVVKDGKVSRDITEEICKVFDGACAQAKASRRRPVTPEQQLFTNTEFEWFSKNAYNISLKHCADMHPAHLVRLLDCCIEFIHLLQNNDPPGDDDSLTLRIMFCHFLATCSFTTLARADDNIQDCVRVLDPECSGVKANPMLLQHYLQVCKHAENFRRNTAQVLQKDDFGESARSDTITKHFQVVKLELEATLKLEKWDELHNLFEECWKYKSPENLESLADLVLVIQSCVVQANVDTKHQEKILSVLQKIINLTWRQSNGDLVKLSRWIRCLFRLALDFDESISMKCLDQASQIAAARKGVSAAPDPRPVLLNTPPASSSPSKPADDAKEPNHYPSTELEWLATTSFNHAIDYYSQDNDEKCKAWAEKALTVSQWAEDGGRLNRVLMEKYSGLVWDE